MMVEEINFNKAMNHGADQIKRQAIASNISLAENIAALSTSYDEKPTVEQ